jgi:hypothetical protein
LVWSIDFDAIRVNVETLHARDNQRLDRSPPLAVSFQRNDDLALMFADAEVAHRFRSMTGVNCSASIVWRGLNAAQQAVQQRGHRTRTSWSPGTGVAVLNKLASMCFSKYLNGAITRIGRQLPSLLHSREKVALEFAYDNYPRYIGASGCNAGTGMAETGGLR